MLNLSAVALICAVCAGISPAVASEHSRGGTFLPMGWDARAEGMGTAVTALARDDRSAFWNPANLTFLRSPRISIGGTKPVPDLDAWYSILSAGSGLIRVGTRPDSSSSMTADPSTAGDGSPTRRFGVGITVSHLGLRLAEGSKWDETVVGLSIAFSPNRMSSVGITGKAMKSRTGVRGADASGTAADIGWTALVLDRLWLAAVARNFVSGISYPGREEEIDPTWNFAVAYERIADRISVEFDAVFKNGEFSRFLAGVEMVVMRDAFFLLGGVDHRLNEGRRTIPSFGVGSIYRDIEIALAFTFDPLDAFGYRTRVSVGYSL